MGNSINHKVAVLGGGSFGTVIANIRDLPGIAEKIPVQFQSRFLELVQATHPIEAEDVLFSLLKVSQGKFTTECINFLIEQGHAEELAKTLRRWQTEQNLRAPVLLWIVKNRHSKKFAKLLNDLISPRLLGAIFFAIDYEALQTSSARRIPLADILSEDTDLISDLLSTADPETARDLAALRLNPWWFSHDRLYTPANDGTGGPFTIGRVIHSSRSVGFTGWIGGVAVFNRALTAEEMGKLSAIRSAVPTENPAR